MEQRYVTPMTNKMKRDSQTTFASLASEYKTTEEDVKFTLRRGIGPVQFAQLESLNKYHEALLRKSGQKLKKLQSIQLTYENVQQQSVPEKDPLEEIMISKRHLEQRLSGIYLEIQENKNRRKEAQAKIEEATARLQEAQKNLSEAEAHASALFLKREELLMQEETTRADLKQVEEEIERVNEEKVTYLVSPNFNGELPKYARKIISSKPFPNERVAVEGLGEDNWYEQPSFELIRRSGVKDFETFKQLFEFAQLVFKYEAECEKCKVLLSESDEPLRVILTALGCDF